MSSSEYQQVHGTQTDQSFVQALYEAALGRSPDASGEQNWLGALSQGTSRAAVALGITESSEAQQHLSANLEFGFAIS
jgi:hypothetical protein